MSQEEKKGVTENVGKWLATVSAILTIGLTGLNAYWSREVSNVESEVKLKAADLERQRLELDAGKERMSRYVFVQNLLSGILSQDQAQKNLTVNLISLALTDKEAEQLFAGLQASNNDNTRQLGSLGRDLALVRNLVLQVNDVSQENRKDAVKNLINDYRGNHNAVEQALLLLEPPKINSLSASGRINILVFLRNTDKIAWTPESISKAELAINQIYSRAKGGIAIGPQTDDALKKLSSHLNSIKE